VIRRHPAQMPSPIENGFAAYLKTASDKEFSTAHGKYRTW